MGGDDSVEDTREEVAGEEEEEEEEDDDDDDEDDNGDVSDIEGREEEDEDDAGNEVLTRGDASSSPVTSCKVSSFLGLRGLLEVRSLGVVTCSCGSVANTNSSLLSLSRIRGVEEETGLPGVEEVPEEEEEEEAEDPLGVGKKAEEEESRSIAAFSARSIN